MNNYNFMVIKIWFLLQRIKDFYPILNIAQSFNLIWIFDSGNNLGQTQCIMKLFRILVTCIMCGCFNCCICTSGLKAFFISEYQIIHSKVHMLREGSTILRNLHLTFVCICTVDKSKVEILQNFVAFSEYANFNQMIIYKSDYRISSYSFLP